MPGLSNRSLPSEMALRWLLMKDSDPPVSANDGMWAPVEAMPASEVEIIAGIVDSRGKSLPVVGLGGLTIAQDPTEAEADGMPRSAIATGMVDWVLPVAEMPARIVAHCENRRRIQAPLVDAIDVFPEKSQQDERDEISLRDKEAFQALELMMPDLFRGNPRETSCGYGSPWCATSKEASSIAIRVTKSGKRIDVALSAWAMKDQPGDVIGSTAIVLDISERKAAVKALQWLCETWFPEKHDLEVHADIDCLEDDDDEETRILAFLAVRELLFNIVKHTEVREAWVKLEAKNDTLMITVRDHGVGFEMSEIQGHSGNGFGFGLVGLKERLEFVGGGFDVKSNQGDGVVAVIRVPLKISAAETPTPTL